MRVEYLEEDIVGDGDHDAVIDRTQADLHRLLGAREQERLRRLVGARISEQQ